MKSISHYFLILSFLGFILFSGCKKESTEATLTIKVLDPTNKLATGINFDILVITDNISLWKNKTSSSSLGEVNIKLTKGKIYFIYLIPTERYSDWYMGNPSATYIKNGTFKSLQEIDYGAIQKPTPKVGDTKYADVNADGLINAEDLVLKVDLNGDKEVTVNLVAGKSAYY